MGKTIEQSKDEVAQSMQEFPDEWAGLYLELRKQHLELQEELKCLVAERKKVSPGLH